MLPLSSEEVGQLGQPLVELGAKTKGDDKLEEEINKFHAMGAQRTIVFDSNEISRLITIPQFVLLYKEIPFCHNNPQNGFKIISLHMI